jgi:hypothetical protein
MTGADAVRRGPGQGTGCSTTSPLPTSATVAAIESACGELSHLNGEPESTSGRTAPRRAIQTQRS